MAAFTMARSGEHKLPIGKTGEDSRRTIQGFDRLNSSELLFGKIEHDFF